MTADAARASGTERASAAHGGPGCISGTKSRRLVDRPEFSRKCQNGLGLVLGRSSGRRLAIPNFRPLQLATLATKMCRTWLAVRTPHRRWIQRRALHALRVTSVDNLRAHNLDRRVLERARRIGGD
jgi:hypothetical protein